MATIEHITLGGGCFWCTEAVYEQVDGVTAVESGYANGELRNPTYEQVCSGNTGHAEVVKVSFDAERISLREVLEIFFHTHDPTTLNRQGNDTGTQYRSGFYWANDEQKALILASRAAYEKALKGKKITTECAAASDYDQYGGVFYYGEDYHQQVSAVLSSITSPLFIPSR